MDTWAWQATVQGVVRVGHDLGTKPTYLPTYVYIGLSIYELCTFLSIFLKLTATAAKSLHSSVTLCDPIDGSPPGSPVPGILQARTLEWVDIYFWNLKLL